MHGGEGSNKAFVLRGLPESSSTTLEEGKIVGGHLGGHRTERVRELIEGGGEVWFCRPTRRTNP